MISQTKRFANYFIGQKLPWLVANWLDFSSPKQNISPTVLIGRKLLDRVSMKKRRARRKDESPEEKRMQNEVAQWVSPALILDIIGPMFCFVFTGRLLTARWVAHLLVALYLS